MNPIMRCGIIFFFFLLMLLAPQCLLHAMDSGPVLRVGCLDVSSFPDGSPERLGDERNYQKYLDRVDRLKDEVAQAAQNASSIRREIDSLP